MSILEWIMSWKGLSTQINTKVTFLWVSEMLEQKWFGESVPTDFKGFNQSPFPYWSAEPITEVIALSVLSKFMIA